MFSTRLTGLLALPALSAALIGAAVLGAAGTAHADDTPGGQYDPGAIQHTTTGPSSAERTTTTPPGVLGSIAGGGIFARTPGTPDLTAGGFVNPFAEQNDATASKREAELNGAPGIIGVPVNGRLIAPNTPEWDKLWEPKPPTPPTLNDRQSLLLDHIASTARGCSSIENPALCRVRHGDFDLKKSGPR